MEERQQQSVREKFAEKFISILESDTPLEWTKGWGTHGSAVPYNGESGRRYNGINRMVLMFRGTEQGWSDPRYYTFHQVSRMDGCKVRAGEKATGVEYWLLWDTKEKRSLTFKEYEKLIKLDPSRKEEEFRLYAKTAYVFNAAQIEGLQPLPQEARSPLEENQLADEVLKTMTENMGVKLVYGGNEAYYTPATDTIHLPPEEAFFTTADRISTTLHEIAHSTGSPSRLDRPLVGFYQDPEHYAMEELRAEIAGCFVASEIDLAMSESVSENNLAYVQHWLSAIKEDHNVLFSAIKDADRIADYMVEQGRVEILREKLTLAAQVPNPLQGIHYEIWQLKDTPENQALLFSGYDFASRFRLTESRYDKVYETKAGRDDYTLEKIYYKFNVEHPADYRGRSMSVSDVVVLNIDGQKTAWYCDAMGFRPVEGFLQKQITEKRGKSR